MSGDKTDTASAPMPTEFLPKMLSRCWREGYRLGGSAGRCAGGADGGHRGAAPVDGDCHRQSGVGPERGLYDRHRGRLPRVACWAGRGIQIGGPAGAFIVLVAACVTATGLEGLILATFLSGVLLIAAGRCGWGPISAIIPYPVTVGFTAGIAVIIFASQLREMFGLTLAGAEPARADRQGCRPCGQARGTVTPAAVAVALR